MNTGSYVPVRIKVFIVFVSVLIVLTLFSSYVRYIYFKDYFFLVEQPCDSDTEQCFVRSCDEYCPPNELESYKTFSVKAYDYQKCSSNKCSNVCSSEEAGGICEEIICNPDNEDDCSQ